MSDSLIEINKKESKEKGAITKRLIFGGSDN